MSGTDDYGQGVSIAALTDAPNAETLAKNIANAIVQRSVMRFASASARSAAIASPAEHMVTSLADTDRTYRYNGSTWEPIAALVQSGNTSVSFTSQTSYTATITFPVAFPATPRVSVNINSLGGSTARWGSRAGTVTATNFTLFVFAGDASSPATWSSVDVQWIATSP